MATKIFKRLNDSSIKDTWTPVLEGYGADVSARPWLVDYAHNHAIFDNAGSALNESAVAPGLFLQQPGSISAMGAIAAPTNSMTPFSAGGAKNGYGANVSGSGDPVGFLPYLDYVYQGGNLDTQYEPFLIKVTDGTAADTNGATSGDFTFTFVGYSRVDGHPIYKVVTGTDGGTTVAAGAVAAGLAAAATGVALVSALENHISGFTSVSDADYATTDFDGPFLGSTGSQSNFSGMKRETAETSKFRQMGLRMFTKFIEAKGDQVAISATVEQIQDLNRVWNFDVISMLENVAVNELAQSINKKLVDKVFKLGAVHNTNIAAVEGAGITNLDLTVGSTGFENISTLQRRVVTKILEMANLIYHRGRFGAGTYIVTNGRVASALADVAGYTFAPFNNDLPSGAGQLYPAGKVHGLTVYVDPNLKFSDNRIHIGRKGADEEPGVKFLPYIMAESLQTIAEGTFSPKIGMKSRYAITEAGWHPETQYITLTVDGLGVLTGSTRPSASY